MTWDGIGYYYFAQGFKITFYGSTNNIVHYIVLFYAEYIQIQYFR